MEIIKQLEGLGPAGILVVLLCCVGAALKRAAWLENKRIPVLLMAIGAVAYPVLARKADVDYTSTLMLYNAALGAVFGWASVGAHQFLKQTFPVLFPNDEEDDKP